jgi:hypothetical protein
MDLDRREGQAAIERRAAPGRASTPMGQADRRRASGRGRIPGSRANHRKPALTAAGVARRAVVRSGLAAGTPSPRPDGARRAPSRSPGQWRSGPRHRASQHTPSCRDGGCRHGGRSRRAPRGRTRQRGGAAHLPSDLPPCFEQATPCNSLGSLMV